MFKAQFKTNSPYEKWTTLGSYGTENQAISAALQKKNKGAILVRVIDKNGGTVFSS
jgi:hypothetical protein